MPQNYSRILIGLLAVIGILLVAVIATVVTGDGEPDDVIAATGSSAADPSAPDSVPSDQTLPTEPPTTLPPPTPTTLPPPTPTTLPPPTTTTLPPPTPTTLPPPTPSTLPLPPIGSLAVTFPPAPTPGSGGASGSGCAPGAGPLPDGYWFGYVRALDGTGFDFDLACFFFGQEAYDAAAADGVNIPGDHYIRNQNATLRRVDVIQTTDVWRVAALDMVTNDFLFYDFADWPTARPNPMMPCPGEYCGVWVFITGGKAGAIVEQFIP